VARRTASKKPSVRTAPDDSERAPAAWPQLLLRQLARHNWVRLHGASRVTVLAGGATARQLWQDWANAAQPQATLLEAETAADFTTLLQRAVAHCAEAPGDAVAVRVPHAVLQAWRTGRRDRLGAMVDEGLIVVEERAATAGRSRAHKTRKPAPALPLAARSVAEAALFEALEATPATAASNSTVGWRCALAERPPRSTCCRDKIGSRSRSTGFTTSPTSSAFAATAAKISCCRPKAWWWCACSPTMSCAMLARR
jgi:hypothetical protein